jgi:CO/xanthine dehydrogenase Mo-binding subunit
MADKLIYVGSQDAVAVDALEKVLGSARYVGDLSFPDLLHARLLLSPYPHAKIVQLDPSPALKIDGVVAVLTHQDFKDHGNFGWPVKDAYVLAYQKVRYVGDIVAVVAGINPDAAQAGVEAILVEYEELPVITDIDQALDVEAPLIPLEPPLGKGNLCERLIVRNQDPDPLLEEADERLQRSYYFAHQEHACLETEGVLAIPESDGSLTIFANNQSPHINRDNAADVLGLAADQVRIIQPPVGGSFGGKDDHVYQMTIQAGKLALMTGKPVRLILDREESLIVSYKREAGRIDIEVGFDQQGDIVAGKGRFVADSGAYASMTPLSAWRASMHLLGTYRYQAASVDTDVVYTNNGYSGAFRGFGNTQAAAASEMLIDEAAALFGRDPLEYRLDLCLRQGDQAFTGNVIEHEVGLRRALEWVRDKSEWTRRRQEYDSQDPTASEKWGLGVACYFHGSGLGGEGLDYARTTIEIERDHTITLQSGLTDYGQGSRTIFTTLAAEVLGVDPGRIHMLRPDTQTALESGPTVASRASIVGGNATRVASEKVLGTLNLAASNLLNCEQDQIHRQGELFIGPDEEPVLFEKVVDHALEMGLQLFSQGYWQIPRIHWDFETGTGIPYYTYSYGAQVAQVFVNKASGDVKVERIWAAHDGGRIIFPKGARGQLLGGIAQGLGYALTEGFEFKDGYPQSTRFSKYVIPSILDMPECETKFIETTLPDGPYGAKNLAEPVMIATAPAIANAIFQAVGVRCYELPIRKDWLKERIRGTGS